jgi:hypothetical protein
VGNTSAYGPSGTVTVNGLGFSAQLYSYDENPAPYTLSPGAVGYVYAVMPVNEFLDGQGVEVQIDVEHTMQSSNSSSVDVFANDSKSEFIRLVPDLCP